MPDPNNQNPNDQNTPVSGDSSAVPPVFSPSADLPPLPPDFQSDSSSSTTTPPGTTTTTSKTVVDSEQKEEDVVEAPAGSAAPMDLPPVVTSGPKKKFGGGRIIATILGLLMLVGGVAGGVILTQQQQLFEQKAQFSQACYDDCREDKGHKVCMCRCGGECLRPDSTTAPSYTTAPGNSQSTCQGAWCAGCGGFCISSSSTMTCNQAQQERCGQASISCSNPVACSAPSGQCCVGEWQNINPTGPEVVYYCSWACYNQYNKCDASVPCHQIRNNVPECFNGVYQVDHPTQPIHMSYRNTCGNEESPPPQPTPTPPPIQASCTNVKAYNTSWTLLTAQQLSALNPGQTINFCVTGSATGGSFNKGRFTINGALQTETTTQRPSSQDFCQSYRIPPAVRTFNVTAQIHHVTLGWR